jgi:hypothetical protein
VSPLPRKPLVSTRIFWVARRLIDQQIHAGSQKRDCYIPQNFTTALYPPLPSRFNCHQSDQNTPRCRINLVIFGVGEFPSPWWRTLVLACSLALEAAPLLEVSVLGPASCPRSASFYNELPSILQRTRRGGPRYCPTVARVCTSYLVRSAFHLSRPSRAERRRIA